MHGMNRLLFTAVVLALGALVVPAGALADGDIDAQLADAMDAINAALAADGADYRAAMAEYLDTTVGGEDQANTVIAKDVGNKQLSTDFVPNDTRRAWSAPFGGPFDDITYAIDTTGDAVPVFGGLTGAQTDAAIVRAMNSWDALTCSHLPIVRNPDFGLDIGVVAFLNGLGGSPFVFADVQHAGWRDINFAGGILGVTFTFIFVDGGGNPTDVDGDGRIDTAFREIYYDPSFSWADDGVTNVDVETVALHEAGHGLSQAHFGFVFIDENGDLKFAPKAVMNAVYVDPQRTLLGTDDAGHCSLWADWPNN